MIDLSKFADSYDRKARLYPILIFLIPILVAIHSLYQDVFAMWSGLVTLIVGFGGLQLLSNLARDRGLKVQARLFKEWGGVPSVAILRYRDPNIPLPAKKRYHQLLAQQTGIDAPSEDSESSNPDAADETYLSWSDYLRGKTRNHNDFPMVFKENINYGFRRNLLGIKWFCVCSGFVGISTIGFKGIKFYIDVGSVSGPLVSILVAILFYLLVFLFTVNKR